MNKLGHGTRAICQALQMSQRTVQEAIKRFKKRLRYGSDRREKRRRCTVNVPSVIKKSLGEPERNWKQFNETDGQEDENRCYLCPNHCQKAAEFEVLSKTTSSLADGKNDEDTSREKQEVARALRERHARAHSLQ